MIGFDATSGLSAVGSISKGQDRGFLCVKSDINLVHLLNTVARQTNKQANVIKLRLDSVICAKALPLQSGNKWLLFTKKASPTLGG